MSVFEKGMTADHVLLIEKESKRLRVARNKVLGRTLYGLVIQWFYQDATLLIARKERNGPYVVVDVQPAIPKLMQEPMSTKQSGLTPEEVVEQLADIDKEKNSDVRKDD